VKATLVISVYKDVLALKAVLRSLLIQTEQSFEVIVSQDAEDACFDELIDGFQSKLNIRLIQQADIGFRKNRMLNQTIRLSNCEKIIFIDGDCILHPKFIEQHVLLLKPNQFCVGRRVDLDAKTSQLIKSEEILIPSFLQMLRNKTIRIEESFFLPRFMRKKKPKLLGCNMSWNKTDLLRLNGFDESYETPGFGEDTDIEYRAIQAGMQAYSTRFRTIQYHLFHERPSREDQVSISKALFFERKARKDFRCQKGLENLAN
jgi:glycosyltransferase involved in cell wall biosynthesis